MPAHKRKTPNSHKALLAVTSHPPPSTKKIIDYDGKAFGVVMTVSFFLVSVDSFTRLYGAVS